MSLYTQRVQTVLSDEQYHLLSRTAAETGKAIRVLIREAIEQIYFVPKAEEARLEALQELLSLNAPVADWEQMKAQIVRGVAQ